MTEAVQIENIAEARRRRGIATDGLERAIQSVREGSIIKLTFQTEGVLPPGLADQARREGWPPPAGESMWVEVTGISGEGPARVFRGELRNRPAFIDPAKLRLGSPVSFTAEQIHSVWED
jgi:hypothetical protein